MLSSAMKARFFQERFMNSSITKITDLSAPQIEKILAAAFKYKKEKVADRTHKNILKGKVVALLFEKQSLRTRLAFEVAAASLGGFPIFLSGTQILAGAGPGDQRESLPDIAHNLERFADIIVARVFRHQTIQTLVKSTKKPVINALCDLHHPSQALADLMTIRWHKKNQKNLKVAFIGDGNNVATSLMHVCAMTGIDFAIASPAGYEIPDLGQKTGVKLASSKLEFLRKPQEAVKNADIVYTDTFVSMGQENETAKRLKDFEGYQVNSTLMKLAKPDAIFLHCLPAHRGQEVTDEVMDGPQSKIFDLAECRLHVAKALLAFYIMRRAAT